MVAAGPTSPPAASGDVSWLRLGFQVAPRCESSTKEPSPLVSRPAAAAASPAHDLSPAEPAEGPSHAVNDKRSRSPLSAAPAPVCQVCGCILIPRPFQSPAAHCVGAGILDLQIPPSIKFNLLGLCRAGGTFSGGRGVAVVLVAAVEGEASCPLP